MENDKKHEISGTNRRSMNIELVDIDKIIPYETNNKIHPEEQIKMIATSIDKFKFDQPLVIDENNIIIKGHGRLLAAQQLKMGKVPCIIRTDMTEAEKKASRIADNKSNESNWDWGNLEIELEELKDMDFDMDWLGFDGEKINIDDFFTNENIQPKEEKMIKCPECGAEFEI